MYIYSSIHYQTKLKYCLVSRFDLPNFRRYTITRQDCPNQNSITEKLLYRFWTQNNMSVYPRGIDNAVTGAADLIMRARTILKSQSTPQTLSCWCNLSFFSSWSQHTVHVWCVYMVCWDCYGMFQLFSHLWSEIQKINYLVHYLVYDRVHLE